VLTTFTIEGEALVPGAARGVALVSAEPLSFWGGYDAATGAIIDQRHPLHGEVARGRVLVVPFSRGSSTTTAVLLEAIRASTAPAAIVTTGRDTFFALASIVSTELYARAAPVVVVSPSDFARLRTGDEVEVRPDGGLVVSRPPAEELGPEPRDLA
jgi:predicted aconitase with swiveling domain